MSDNINDILENKKIAILGFGMEGKSTFNFIKKMIPLSQIIIADRSEDIQKYLSPDELEMLNLSLGEKYLENLENVDLVIKSPGITKERVLEYFPIEKVTSQADLFIRFYADQIIGVTGTKGKSTTSSLIHHIFEVVGRKSILLGNIGKPPFDYIQKITEDTHIVYELSSHQLDDVHYSPHIAIILNLFEEHLDHYGTFEKYKNAKYNISRFQKPNNWLIINGDDPTLKSKYENLVSNKLFFSDHLESVNGAFILDSEDIQLNFEETILSYDFNERIALPGKHNLKNIMAALLAVKISGVEDKAIVKSVNSFKGLEHRLENVGLFKGIHFYNDSIATIPEATIEAVKTLKTVDTLILGGKDRGIDYQVLIDFLTESRVQNILFLGEAGKRICNGIKTQGRFKGNMFLIKSFDEIKELVLKNTPSGTICLLSPAASSYDMFSNFEERGNAFKKIAGNL